MSTTTSGTLGRSGTGWVTYAAVMLGLAGTFNVVDGIIALANAKFYVAGATYVFSDLRTWAWIVLVLGALELFAAVQVTRGSEFARWFGVGAASVNSIAQLMFLPSYPFWAIAAFAMDVLIVYALIVYGGSRVKAWS